MVKRGVVDYVRKMLQQGYSPDSIKASLAESGYGTDEINEAFGIYYSTSTKKSWGYIHLIVLFAVIIVLAVIGTIYYFYSQKNFIGAGGEEIKFDVKIISSNITPGGVATVAVEFKNFEKFRNSDAVVKYEVISKDESYIIATQEEKIKIGELPKKQADIKIPLSAKTGDYILRTTAALENKKSISLSDFKINNLDSSNKKNLPKQSSNQTGSDSAITGEPKSSNSNDENTRLNSQDIFSSDPYDALDQVKELAKIDEKSALLKCSNFRLTAFTYTCYKNIGEVAINPDYCEKINDEIVRNDCFSSIAKLSKDDSICEKISSVRKKDLCYQTFMLELKDYSVCFKINDMNLKSICESLRSSVVG